jgi:hypothetical protein
VCLALRGSPSRRAPRKPKQARRDAPARITAPRRLGRSEAQPRCASPCEARPPGEPRVSRSRPGGMRRRESQPPAGLAGRRHSQGATSRAGGRLPGGRGRRGAKDGSRVRHGRCAHTSPRREPGDSGWQRFPRVMPGVLAAEQSHRRMAGRGAWFSCPESPGSRPGLVCFRDAERQTHPVPKQECQDARGERPAMGHGQPRPRTVVAQAGAGVVPTPGSSAGVVSPAAGAAAACRRGRGG